MSKYRWPIALLALASALAVALLIPASALADRPGSAKPASGGIEIVAKKSLKQLEFPPQWGKPTKGRTVTRLTGVLGTVPDGGNRYAILVGISDYAGDVPDLEYADDDAVAMASMLAGVYGFDSVTTLTDSGATATAIMGVISSLNGTVTAQDEVVFFYSGHGVKGPGGEGILSHDIQYIPGGQLRDAFRGFATSRVIFIFDSCLAGGMTDLAKSGRIVLMATSKVGYAVEMGEEIQHGLFTYFLLGGVMTGEADFVDHDGNPATLDVTVEEDYLYAESILEELSRLGFVDPGTGLRFWQVPTIADLFKGDLLL